MERLISGSKGNEAKHTHSTKFSNTLVDSVCDVVLVDARLLRLANSMNASDGL